MITLANSESPDKMLHNAAFHQSQTKMIFIERNKILI